MFKSESLWCGLPRLETHKYSEAALASSVVNGVSVEDNVEFCQSLFGKQVPVSSVSNKNETIDVTSCTKGYGYKGSYPLGCTRLPGHWRRLRTTDSCSFFLCFSMDCNGKQPGQA